MVDRCQLNPYVSFADLGRIGMHNPERDVLAGNADLLFGEGHLHSEQRFQSKHARNPSASLCGHASGQLSYVQRRSSFNTKGPRKQLGQKSYF